jgi:hypothetical protein
MITNAWLVVGLEMQDSREKHERPIVPQFFGRLSAITRLIATPPAALGETGVRPQFRVPTWIAKSSFDPVSTSIGRQKSRQP